MTGRDWSEYVRSEIRAGWMDSLRSDPPRARIAFRIGTPAYVVGYVARMALRPILPAYDVASSASRQCYIDTGRYMTRRESGER